MPHLSIAAIWAGETLSLTSGSRSSRRRCFRFRNSLPAARTGAHEDQLADEIGRLQRDFLRHHAADREAEDIHLGQTKCSDEGDRVGAHLLERGRDLARAARDAGVVEQDHLTVASQAIRHRRVPIIHGARVVLVEDDRHPAGLAESAIGEADSVSLYELCRRGLVSMSHYGRFFVTLYFTHLGCSGHLRFLFFMWFGRASCSPTSERSPASSSIKPAVQAFIPPSTVRFDPVMYEDSGPAMTATAAAISSTCRVQPFRNSVTCCTNSSG